MDGKAAITCLTDGVNSFGGKKRGSGISRYSDASVLISRLEHLGEQ